VLALVFAFSCTPSPSTTAAKVLPGPELCGNGLYESAIEACDPSSASAPGCATGTSCQACQCVAESSGVCGNGVVEAVEQCETTSACSPGTYCRKCACVFRQAPALFVDSSDSDRTDRLGRDLSRVEMTVKGPPEDVLTVFAANASGPGPVELCLVIAQGATEVQRFCVREQIGQITAAYVRDSAGQRALAPTTDFRDVSLTSVDAKLGSVLRVQSAVGLRFERALGFHWESAYDGALADRLPDAGEISFTEIMGRE